MLKNKILLTLLFSFLSLFLYSQVTIDKGTGITYTKGIPTHVPRVKADSEINIDINTGKIYRWNRTASAWRLIAEGTDIGNFTGQPTYVPGYGQSPFVINNQKKIYYYSGGWSCLNCSLGNVITKNGITKLVDTIYLGGYLDRNTEIDGTGVYPFKLDSLSSFYTLVQTSAGSASQLFSLLPTSSSGINLTSTSTSNANVNTNLNVRPGNPSQFVSRNDTLHAYLRLSADSTIIGQGLQSGYFTTNKRIIITKDSLIFTEIDYTPTRSISRLVITAAGVVFKDSTTIDEDSTNEFQTLSIAGDTLSISNGNSVILNLPSNLNAGTGISISGDTIYNTGDLSNTNELQYIDSLYLSGDTLFLSLYLDSIPAEGIDLGSLIAGNGIYGGSGNVPPATTATLDSNLVFRADNDLGKFQTIINSSLGLFGSNFTIIPDSLTLSYFDVAGTTRVTLDQDGILLLTPASDRVTIQGNDARYAADYRSTYNGRSLIDKKYGDDFYLQEVDTFRVSNDTLYISLSNDSIPQKFVVIPGAVASTDTSGYNLSFTRSNDTLFIRDGIGQLFVKLPAIDDNQTLTIDSVSISTGERYTISIESGNSIYLDDDDQQKIDTFRVNGSNVELSLQRDNESVKTIPVTSIAPVQSVIAGSGISVSGTNNLTVANTGDLSSTNEIQRLDTFTIVSNVLLASLLNDGVPFSSVDLSPYVNVATNLLYTNAVSPVTINSSTGTDLTVTAGTGISLAATSTNMTITNTAPDQTVTLNNGTGISVSGTYPTFTITNTSLNTDAQTLAIDSSIVGSSERFALTISGGNTIRFDIPQGIFLTDGDKGDIDVSSSGTIWTVDTSAITMVKIAANAVDSTKIINGGVSVLDIGQNGASSGQVLRWNGTAWTAAGINNYDLVTSSQTVSAAINQVFVNTITANITLNLAPCSAANDGVKFEFVKMGTDTFSVIIDPSGVEQFFDGAADKRLYSRGTSISCTCRWNGSSGTWLYIMW